MRKIIQAFENMPLREVIDCRVTGLRDILLYYGVEIDSYTLFIMSCGIEFCFQQSKLKEDSNVLVWWIGGSTMSLEDDLLENMSIPQTKYYFDNDEQGWDSLKGFIDKDIPVMIVLDSNYVHTHRIEKDLTRSYIGAVSAGPLVGYDMEKQVVYMDFKDDVSVELYTVSMEDFMTARNTKCFPYSPQNECYTMEVKEGYCNWFKQHQSEMIEKSLLQVCQRMLKQNNDPYKSYGIDGMRMVSKVLLDFSKNLKEADVDEKFSNMLFRLKFKCLRQGMLPGSNTFYREEFGKGLKKVAEVLKCSTLKKIGDGFLDSGKKWRNMARLLGTADFKVKEKEAYFAKVAKAFNQIADHEEKLFLRLQKCFTA